MSLILDSYSSTFFDLFPTSSSVTQLLFSLIFIYILYLYLKGVYFSFILKASMLFSDQHVGSSIGPDGVHDYNPTVGIIMGGTL